MTISRAVRPCFRAFWDERAWPWGVRGPVLCWALAALAARRAGELDMILETSRLHFEAWVGRAVRRVFVSCGGLERLSCGLAVTMLFR